MRPLSRGELDDHSSYREEVRRYYDTNTAIFRVFEPEGDTIHRAVWAPGVRGRRAALAYTNGRVVEEAARLASQTSAPLSIVDLGCGTGGTFLHLGQHLQSPWRGLAITLSPAQVERARANVERHGLGDRCSVMLADYLRVPHEGPFDLAVAIESFVHCPDPASFFREAARLVRRGGKLVVCDDLLSARGASAEQLEPEESACLRHFSRGWLAPAPQSVRSLVTAAESAGFRLEADVDLTPSLRILPFSRHAASQALAGVVMKADALGHPLVRGLTGGLALQMALARGLLEYRWISLTRA